MVSLMQRRREMMQLASSPAPTPIIPDDYQQIEYVLRSASVSGTSGYNSLMYRLNGVDEVEVRLGAMPSYKQQASYGYIISCRQTNSDNTIAYGINYDQNNTTISSWDGALCSISPNNGNSLVGIRTDIIATKTPTGQTITDGTNSNAATDTPRVMASDLFIFGMQRYNSGAINAFRGRIYYLQVKEAGVTVIDLIPCKRKSDGAVGFYDRAQERFFSNTNYTAGPDV